MTCKIKAENKSFTGQLILLGIMVIFTVLTPVLGRAEEESTPQKIFDFAQHLFEKGEYYRAITEFERLIFHFPQHALVRRAKLQIAYCYRGGEKWEKALELFAGVVEGFLKTNEGKIALFEIAETYFLRGDYPLAIAHYINFLEQYPKADLSHKARYRLGWSYIYEGLPEDSSREFNLVTSGEYQRPARLLSEKVLDYVQMPQKKPRVAGTLSAFIPGAGQVYTGRNIDAWVSFLLNGSFIAGTVEAFDQGLGIVGGILLFFEAGWYAGNIYNAVSNAHKYNHKQRDLFYEGLQAISVEALNGMIQQKGMMLRFSFEF
jgi:tetratricopeptide (TPR) repeat protein